MIKRVLKETRISRLKMEAENKETRKVIAQWKNFLAKYQIACDDLSERIQKWDALHSSETDLTKDKVESEAILKYKRAHAEKLRKLEEYQRMKKLRHARDCPSCRAAKRYLKYAKPTKMGKKKRAYPAAA